VVAEKAPQKPAADPNAEVLKAVNDWAEAWSKKDANAYLSYYAVDFKTPGGEARPAWEKTRRERIAAPKSIEVKVDSPKVTLRGQQRGERDVPPGLPLRQAHQLEHQDPGAGEGRWPLQIREEKAGK